MLKIHTQPNDVTCGPTSLHAVYGYYGDTISLEQVVAEVEMVATGGTIAALLGQHALLRGYEVDLYVYNVNFFDPTWFVPTPLSMPKLSAKLRSQINYKRKKRFIASSRAYIHFIELGGTIRFHDLTPELLAGYLHYQQPVITGLSATYLYQNSRELDKDSQIIYDDLRGKPLGHFVVLCDLDQNMRTVTIADPHVENPLYHDNYYVVNTSRLINAIMLGVLTYDANLLIIKPKNLL